ncbi:MAG: N-acetyltransferase family protein [Bdellovibrionales bacterium]
MELIIRKASAHDTSQILSYIRELAEFEKLSHEVTATEEILKKSLFSEGSNARVFIAEENQKPVGFALTFFNFSTFLGRKGLYLEDLYISPKHRGKSYGTKLLRFLAQFAKEEGCGRFEWSVLDWNQKAIDLYTKLGAKPMSEWTMYRMDEETLEKFAQSSRE